MKKKTGNPSTKQNASVSPEAQLGALISRLDPEQQKLTQSLRTAFRKRFPTANELVYDYTKQVVIAYSPNENGIDGIVSIAAHAEGTDVHLNNGPKLPDPTKLLQGSGKMTRFLRIDSARQLAQPDISSLIDAAVSHARVPLPANGKGGLVIKTSKASGAKKPAAKTARTAKKNSGPKKSRTVRRK